MKVTMNCVSHSHVDKYLKLVELLYKHKGARKAIDLLKDYQLYTRQVTLGITPEPIAWCKVDNSGFPRVLNPWKGLILSSDHRVKQEVNTLFGAVKLLKLSPCTDTRTITAPFTGDPGFLSEFTNYCKTWKGVKRQNLTPITDIPLRASAGPNGPAILTALSDISALMADPSLEESVLNLMGQTCPIVRDYYVSKRLGMEADRSQTHSRLTFISDKSGKTRVVAIADY
jgi:hypothetical protein